MAYTVVFEDIIFVEGNFKNAVLGKELSCDLSFKFGAQLKNLNDVKRDLANKARILGYNAIVNFTYGQKSRWLAIDDVAFWGKGIGANINLEEYEKIINKNELSTFK